MRQFKYVDFGKWASTQNFDKIKWKNFTDYLYELILQNLRNPQLHTVFGSI